MSILVQRVLEDRVPNLLEKLLDKPSLVSPPTVEEGGLLLYLIMLAVAYEKTHVLARDLRGVGCGELDVKGIYSLQMEELRAESQLSSESTGTIGRSKGGFNWVFSPANICYCGDSLCVGMKKQFLDALCFHLRKNLNCKLYANSLIGVGVASILYHVSRGRLRKYLRWADYTMIATDTVCLSRAIRDENSNLLMAASALILPIKPLMVSAVHTGMMEAQAEYKAYFMDSLIR